MKRLLKSLIPFIIILSIVPMSAFAANTSQTENVIYFEDGSYLTIELTVANTRALDLITGSKTYVYRNSNSVEQWRAVLTGTFSYNGSSATCSVSTCDVTITNTNWYVISKTATKSGNVARCSLTMGLKQLGVTVDEYSTTIKLTCDARGNLS